MLDSTLTPDSATPTLNKSKEEYYSSISSAECVPARGGGGGG
jgi:hypothetical protein